MPNQHVTADNPPPYDDGLWHPEISYRKQYNDRYMWSWRAARVVYVDQWGYGPSKSTDHWQLDYDNGRNYGNRTMFKIYAKFRAKRLAAKLNAMDSRKRKHTEQWVEA